MAKHRMFGFGRHSEEPEPDFKTYAEYQNWKHEKKLEKRHQKELYKRRKWEFKYRQPYYDTP